MAKARCIGGFYYRAKIAVSDIAAVGAVDGKGRLFIQRQLIIGT